MERLNDENIELLIKILSSSDVSITFKSNIPYLCIGTKEDYGVLDRVTITDPTIYRGFVEPELMIKLKSFLLNELKLHRELEKSGISPGSNPALATIDNVKYRC